MTLPPELLGPNRPQATCSHAPAPKTQNFKVLSIHLVRFEAAIAWITEGKTFFFASVWMLCSRFPDSLVKRMDGYHSKANGRTALDAKSHTTHRTAKACQMSLLHLSLTQASLHLSAARQEPLCGAIAAD